MAVDLSQYKVMSRRKAALIICGILVIGLVVCLIGLEWVNTYFDSIKELADENHDEAMEKGLYVIRFLITAAASFTILLSGYVAWYASRVFTTGHNPPLGYWIIEGQKIHTGKKARMTGYALIALSILLIVLGIGSLIIGFRLIETLITP